MAVEEVRREVRVQGAAAQRLAALEGKLTTLEGSLLSAGETLSHLRVRARRCCAASWVGSAIHTYQNTSGACLAASGLSMFCDPTGKSMAWAS